MTPTPDEVASLKAALRGIAQHLRRCRTTIGELAYPLLASDADVIENAADALESLSPPAGMEQIRALVKSALTASDNSLRWYIEQINTATQAGQSRAAAPSQEGHAAGPASAAPPAGMVMVPIELLGYLTMAVIKPFSKHPGTQPHGSDYKRCVVCGAEWTATSGDHLHGAGCPIAAIMRLLSATTKEKS